MPGSSLGMLGFAALALAGSLHCAGMCGGFAATVALGARSRGAGLLRALAAYTAGKATTYAFVGTWIALGASWVGGQHPSLLPAHALQRALAWAVGGALVAMGFALAWSPGRTFGAGLLRRVSPLVGRLFAGARVIPGAGGDYAVGLATGLLPCGLSLGAWLLASQVPPPQAALGCLVFGLATAPALWAVALGAAGLGSGAVPPRLRAALARLAGPVLIALGAVTVLRGARWTDPASPPPCCSGDGGEVSQDVPLGQGPEESVTLEDGRRRRP